MMISVNIAAESDIGNIDGGDIAPSDTNLTPYLAANATIAVKYSLEERLNSFL
ncbi:hypothetical protein [Neiella marina]|uniref:hypothetical protein n=1 Tax=Neiella marina TaxID=508461 RepID=UPI001302A0A6|nr:hypothetical protein [Neiella marina]